MAKQTSLFNPNVKPVDFKKIITWLPNSPKQTITVDKLGRRSHFQCYYRQDKNAIVIPYLDRNKHPQEYQIKQKEWDSVCKVVEWALKRGVNPELTYWYNNHPNHPEAPHVPNPIFGPNVPAICRRYNECF